MGIDHLDNKLFQHVRDTHHEDTPDCGLCSLISERERQRFKKRLEKGTTLVKIPSLGDILPKRRRR